MIELLGRLVAPLNQVSLQLWNQPVTWAELLGFVTGGACVWLTVRSLVANFPVGIANCAFFLVLFASARLWADAVLQVVFVVLGFLGWWKWLHGGEQRTPLVVVRASRSGLAACVGFVILGTVGLTLLLRAAHDSAPFWDALTTCLSLAAQWLLNTKKVETWWFWAVADCIYIPLYVSKGLYLTGLVYVLFLTMCIAGARAWMNAHDRLADEVASKSPTAAGCG